ncbi:chromosome segregation protein SMC [Leeia aquatica]|uniref:Chromosome partition protein Smc n=1 Tax=Leeia aquatica TaxID=2725557 RepID=A0A847S4B2_9NEIS|nr:chromosome segregation protein SMC [Leeia aquatica]NLR74604.1 chromosome segregation protein SMC [Leeia aquatica]
MRLKQIKLAGFKSFVDPVHIAVPGQLVAVVGPNGCGKSNIIDAVRWVLGESSAKQLRGESMQDVIFNGSGGRKPVSRASVELVFDNSLQRASGPWAAYGEIGIKRILTRDGGSTYHINNQQVRRRDITDLFLGTGVGSRGYAVIEQGMISRIIEARPEELRDFLEEAAGVSKYKERRRETEHRLTDTRENLLRVDDVRAELLRQVEKLSSQAEVARQYRALQDALQQSQGLLALARQQEAHLKLEQLSRQQQEGGTALEAAIAALRQTEASLELAREAHFQHNDQLHAAQARLFDANAHLARLEQQLQHQQTMQQQLQQRSQQLKQQLGQGLQQQQQLQEEQHSLQLQGEEAREQLEEAELQLQLLEDQLPDHEQAVLQARQQLEQQQQQAQQLRQRLGVLDTQLRQAQQQLQQLQQREQRWQQRQQNLVLLDPQRVQQAAAEREQAEVALVTLQQAAEAAVHAEQQAELALQQASQQLQQLEREESAMLSEQKALQTLLHAGQGRQALQDWLQAHGLAAEALWQQVQVEPGWEVAVAAVLQQRLQARALPAGLDWRSLSPPQALTLLPDAPPAAASAPSSLRRKVLCADPQWSCWLDLWLADVEVVPADAPVPDTLPPQSVWVSPQGHRMQADGIHLHAEAPADQMLAQQRALQQLEQSLAAHQPQVQGGRNAQQAAQVKQQQARAAQREVQERLRQTQQALHQAELSWRQAEQQQAHQLSQQTQLQQEQEELQAQRLHWQEEQETAAFEQDGLRDTLSQHEAGLQLAREHLNAADQRLGQVRNQLRDAERQAQNLRFAVSSRVQRASELVHRSEQLATLQAEREEQLQALLLEQDSLQEQDLQLDLQAAIAAREEREGVLRQAREVLEAATRQQRQLDEQRLQQERALEPLREALLQLELQAQEARLTVAQFAEALEGVDVAALQEQLQQRGLKAPGLAREIQRLSREVEALGAVNLAALEELQQAQERAGYLEAQASDLNQAIDTLEAAIRRIDRETRSLLQDTFERVNASLGELFPLLFGGGRATLSLTGEEILDSGVHLMAQPPGKKNSTIHLLSGGEKALTALALVFSLFRLNPAPFCLLDEVDAPLDDANTGRFCEMVKKMSADTQFLYISHNKITMEMAEQLIGITMQEQGVSRVVAVDIMEAMQLSGAA